MLIQNDKNVLCSLITITWLCTILNNSAADKKQKKWEKRTQKKAYTEYQEMEGKRTEW